MTKSWVVLSALLGLSWAPRASASELSAAGVEDRLMVVFRDGVGQKDRLSLAAAQGLEVLRSYGALRAVVVKTKPGQAFQAESALKSDSRVLMVGRDFYTKWIEAAPASVPDAPLPSVGAVLRRLPKLRKGTGQAPEEVQWGVKRVNAPAAWATNQGAGVKVGVVDTGIDATHPELAAAVKGGYNAVEEGKPWADDHFHGTHVSGIIAAAMNGQGVVGVAPQASLYGVKVLTKEGSGSLFGILGGMNWCIENGMQVVNMSLGTAQGNQLFEYGVKSLDQAGITLVAAAGNGDGHGGSSPVNFPAAYPSAIAISALDQSDGITKWSSRGPEVAFIAPGLKIPSTVPLWHDASGVKAYSGTSMATPHVTGLAALAIAAGASGPAAVRAALKRAAEPVALSPEEQGAGVINAAKLAR